MKPDLIFHANLQDDFAVLGIADADDQAATPVFFAKVLPPKPAPSPQQLAAWAGMLPPVTQPTLTPKEHVAQPGTWYEAHPPSMQNGAKATVTEVQDQSTMMPFELLLLAYASGFEDCWNDENGQSVSHPGALALLASLGAAASQSFQTSYGQGAPPPPPPQKSSLQQLVDLLLKQPPLLKLPPASPPPEVPAAPVQESIDSFDQEMASLDSFLNDARSKAGGL